jgi:hypothetical protein
MLLPGHELRTHAKVSIITSYLIQGSSDNDVKVEGKYLALQACGWVVHPKPREAALPTRRAERPGLYIRMHFNILVRKANKPEGHMNQIPFYGSK